ncbi:MAG: ABC transporter permease [Ruminococcus sp.]|nr:ABC transporter permease [Ruminococcus sp.]
MIRLIKNELVKIFKKRSFMIVTIVFILYALLTNFIYKDMDNYNLESGPDIKELESINKDLDITLEENLDEYIENISMIDALKLKDKFKGTSTDYLIDTYLYDIIFEKYTNKYKTKDPNLDITLENKYNILYTKIKNNDYKYFLNLEKERIEEKIKTATDKKVLKLNESLLKIYEYRLDNSIPYDNQDYLYQSINYITTNLAEYYNLKDKNGLTKEETKRLNFLEKEININKYVIENKININDSSSLYAVLKNFSSEFELFILIYIVLICGSIVSEEFNKGTIKFLLTKPYKRSTILTSKLLTVLLLVPLVILFMIITEIILGGIILGFKTIELPAILYNHSLISVPILKYLLLTLGAKIPIYLILTVFSFMLSVITLSTSASITLTFLLYLVGNIINSLALTYSFNLFKLFVSLHWDFSYLINFTNNPYNIKPLISLLVVGIYIIIMLIISYMFFNKKDVKNI